MGAGASVLEGAAVAFELRGAVDASSVIQCGTLDGRPRFVMVTRPYARAFDVRVRGRV